MVARREVVDVVGRGVLLELDLAAVHRPEAQFLLLLARRCRLFDRLLRRQVGRFLLRKPVHLRPMSTEKLLTMNGFS